MKKEILFAVDSTGDGGAGRVVSIIANELAERGWKVHLMTLFTGQTNYPLNPEVDVINIAKDYISNKLDVPRLVFASRRELKKLQCDAVIAFMATISFIISLALKHQNSKFIVSERGDPRYNSRLRNFMSLYSYSRASACVFQTETVKKCYPDYIQSKGIVIPNPVNLHIVSSQNKKPRIVTIGRLFPQKNHEMLINSFSDIHKLHPEYTLEIYGEGELRKQLQAQIDSLGLHDNVYLRGKLSNVHSYITDAELFVFSSNAEGMANALIEAMIMGLPCISTDVAGAKEIIDDGVNGLIVPVRDREKLTEAILKLIDDKELARSFGENAKKCAEKFSLKKIADQWENLILKVIRS